MTDAELLAALAGWDRERAARWADVAALRGAAYTAAAGKYTAAKAQMRAVADEAKRRGIRGQLGRSVPSATVDFRFDVSSGLAGVVAVADGAVRFPDPERLALRDQLRAAVAALDVCEGQVLRGTFAGPLPPGTKTDVENRVLLNIALSKRCLRHGFAFEHDQNSPAGWSCGYRYRAVDAADPFELWRPRRLLTRWQTIRLTHGLTAAAIWWALRTARQPGSLGPAAAAPATLLRATVTSPLTLSLDQIKAVADGVVAAAQWTRELAPIGVERLAANLARAGISAEPAALSALLQEASGAGGGHCDGGLIATDGRVNPDDHLVVAGLVHVRTQATPAPALTAAFLRSRVNPRLNIAYPGRPERTTRLTHNATARRRPGAESRPNQQRRQPANVGLRRKLVIEFPSGTVGMTTSSVRYVELGATPWQSWFPE
jgi:hypothetical protein